MGVAVFGFVAVRRRPISAGSLGRRLLNPPDGLEQRRQLPMSQQIHRVAHCRCECVRNRFNQRQRGAELILQRYEHALSRIPSAYSLMTLYGEGVGAAVQRRVELVRELARDAEGAVTDDAPAFDRPAIRLDDAVDLLGCEVPSEATAGEDLSISCYFKVRRALTRNFDVFVHVVGGIFIHGDHAPVGGFLPTSEWPVGRIVRDRFRVHVPGDYHGELSPRIGLYAGSRRASAVVIAGDALDYVDEDGRIVLDSIRVP